MTEADTAFARAVLEGDLEESRKLLVSGVDPNLVIGAKRGRRQATRDVIPDGFTALHVAAYHDDEALCELMLEFAADPLRATRFGSSAPSIAADWDSPAVMRVFIAAGVDLDAAGALLATAAGHANLPMIELLLAAGARRGMGHALANSCGHSGNIDVLRTLIAGGAVPSEVAVGEWTLRVATLDRRRYAGLELLREAFPATTLIDAVIDGDSNQVARMMAEGAAVDEPLRYDLTALACAARLGRRELAIELLDAGAALDRKTLWGTAVECALVEGHLELATVLHERGASLAKLHSKVIRARCGVEPLLWLCEREPPENLDGLLCVAITVRNAAAAAALLSRGASPEGTDGWGRSALTLAVAANYVEGVQLLLDAGADPKARNENGHPIIHYVLTYDDVTPDWMNPDFDPADYDRNSRALQREAVQLILAAGAPLPWDDAG